MYDLKMEWIACSLGEVERRNPMTKRQMAEGRQAAGLPEMLGKRRQDSPEIPGKSRQSLPHTLGKSKQGFPAAERQRDDGQMRRRSAGERLISLLYPRHCPICHDIVLPKGEKLCPGCEKKVPYVEEPTCLRCGKPIAAKEVEYCYDCTRKRRLFTQGFALTVYDEIMRESIRYYKNKGRMEYADWYGEEIIARYGAGLRQLRAQALVPVPLHPSRQTERGYNQAELIAGRLGRSLGVPVLPRALRRRQKTVAQKYLGAGARSHNLESVFAPGRQPVTGMTVILVDDIYTTGATAEYCTEVLLQAGARAVYLVNVCIGEEEG